MLRIVPGCHSGNASGSAESCGDDLHCTERGHSPARVFHQEQTAAWRVGNAGSPPLLILHLNVELPPKLPCITFYFSPVGYVLEQLLYVAFYGDPVGSSHLPAVISSQLTLTPHSLWFYLGFFICLIGLRGFVYLGFCLFWFELFICFFINDWLSWHSQTQGNVNQT